jgi:hypothetical protein
VRKRPLKLRNESIMISWENLVVSLLRREQRTKIIVIDATNIDHGTRDVEMGNLEWAAQGKSSTKDSASVRRGG